MPAGTTTTLPPGPAKRLLDSAGLARTAPGAAQNRRHREMAQLNQKACPDDSARLAFPRALGPSGKGEGETCGRAALARADPPDPTQARLPAGEDRARP